MSAVVAAEGRSLPSWARPAGVVVLVLAAVAAFLLIGVAGDVEFALAFRSRTLLALIVVGWVAGVTSVAFQTITGNRILTPSVLGFDALHALIQTLLVFLLGAAFATKVPRGIIFAGSAPLMAGVGVLLFGWLFVWRRRSVHLVLLIGLVLATGLRSAATMIQRIMDPSSFLVLQGNLFASFNGIDPVLLAVGGAMMLVASALLWRQRRLLDVVALGRDVAVGLGVRYRRVVLTTVGLCALMVATATALVGPMMFLGLLVSNLAWLLAPTSRHAVVMPLAGAFGIITLVAGQALLQHVFGLATVLSVVVELVGGVVFIALLMKGARR